MATGLSVITAYFLGKFCGDHWRNTTPGPQDNLLKLGKLVIRLVKWKSEMGLQLEVQQTAIASEARILKPE
jgi:hypothetical protein